MIIDCKFTLKQIDILAKTMTVLIDTREKENRHITDYFTKHKILYERQALSYGDYSFFIPANSDLGIKQGIYFHKEIVIERKGSLNELSGNFGKGRERFEKELLKGCKDGCKLFLMVEDSKGYSAIMKHEYDTQFKPLPYMASLKSFENRYNLNIQFVDKQHAGYIIYSTFYYYLRENMT